MKIKRSILVVIALVGITACERSSLGLLFRRVAQLATAEDGLESPTIVIPDTASVWVPFVVEIATFQNRFCEASAGSDVERVGPLSMTVTPMVRTVAGPNCPDAGAYRTIRARILFTRPGIATVTINAEQDPRNTPIEREYEVLVR